MILDFHYPGGRSYCGDSVEDPGIRMQDAIPHYIHPSVVHPKNLAYVVRIFCLADPQKCIGIGAHHFYGGIAAPFEFFHDIF